MQTRHSTLRPVSASEVRTTVLASEAEVSSDLVLVLQQEAGLSAFQNENARSRGHLDLTFGQRRHSHHKSADVMAGILGLASLVSESEVAPTEPVVADAPPLPPAKRRPSKLVKDFAPRKAKPAPPSAASQRLALSQLLQTKLSAQFLPTGLPLRGSGLLAASLDMYLRSMDQNNTVESPSPSGKLRKAAIHVAIALFIRSDKEQLARCH